MPGEADFEEFDALFGGLFTNEEILLIKAEWEDPLTRNLIVLAVFHRSEWRGMLHQVGTLLREWLLAHPDQATKDLPSLFFLADAGCPPDFWRTI